MHGHRSWSFIDLIRSPFLKILKSFSLSISFHLFSSLFISFHLFSSLFISFHLLPVSFTCSFQALTAEELAKVARRPQVDPKLRRLRAASCPAEWPWDVWFKFQVIRYRHTLQSFSCPPKVSEKRMYYKGAIKFLYEAVSKHLHTKTVLRNLHKWSLHPASLSANYVKHPCFSGEVEADIERLVHELGLVPFPADFVDSSDWTGCLERSGKDR